LAKKEEKRKVFLKLEGEDWIGEAIDAEGAPPIDISKLKVKATDLMLLSLGYCFGITVQAYTNHKGYKIEDLQIEVIGKKHDRENRYEEITLNVSLNQTLHQNKSKGLWR